MPGHSSTSIQAIMSLVPFVVNLLHVATSNSDDRRTDRITDEL